MAGTLTALAVPALAGLLAVIATVIFIPAVIVGVHRVIVFWDIGEIGDVNFWAAANLDMDIAGSAKL